MKKLYYEDQYIKKFTANIVELKEIDNKFHIVLNKTAFFPGGGGQFCDLGKIDGKGVLEVYEKDKKIYHVLNDKPSENTVECIIDWDRREDGMHQHFAQHVLSGCFYTKYKANTTGFHLGKDFSTVDIKGYLEEEQIREIENYANEIIRENILLTILTPNKDELKDIWLRRDLPDTDEDIRVVRIGDLDTNACCGVHPKSTGELRLIKIKRWEKNRQSTRIEFLAGQRAIDYVLRRDVCLTKICRHLKSKEEEALNVIRGLEEKIEEGNKIRKKLENKVSNYEIKEILKNSKNYKGILVADKVYEDEDIKYINRMASKVVEEDNRIVLIGVKYKDKANLVFASSKNLSKISMNDLIKEALEVVNGKGGGSINLAQGSCTNFKNLEKVIQDAIDTIEEII